MEQRVSEPLQRATYVPVPKEALEQAIAAIDDLLELKVVLAVFRGLARRRPARWVTARELMEEPALRAALARSSEQAGAERVASALHAARERGLVVSARARDASEEDGREPTADEVCYALNTRESRRALEAAGWQVEERPVTWQAEQASPGRSNIFTLYEQNIGLVTPLLADELAEAERTYPAEWIVAAFREAVDLNRRNWRYIRRILENWASEGRGERGTSRRDAQAARNRRRNLGGRFGPAAGR